MTSKKNCVVGLTGITVHPIANNIEEMSLGEYSRVE